MLLPRGIYKLRREAYAFAENAFLCVLNCEGMAIELETGTAEQQGWVRGAVIGAGAHGIVSLAMNSSNGHLFAVKSAASFSWVLDNEYKILQCLDSPYIVRSLGRNYSLENGVRMSNLFMEYMPGGSIGDLLSKFGGPLDESVVSAYTRGILRGIHYLHSQGIVHCDIKGKNVLVGINGVKLADFGSAKKIGDDGDCREPLQLRGTFLWMAPEVVNQVEQGPASDIWSLGCTVLEMATGRHPWSQVSNPLAAMYRIGCTEELPELPVSLSPRIQDFLEKCFRRDPKKRWTSAELLNHPFLNEDCTNMEKEEVVAGPGSPTTNLDFGNQAWNSCSCQPTPILSLAIPNPVGECDAEACSNKSIEQCPRPSPRNRIMALASEFENVADGPNWSANPPGQWITVRSSRGKSTTSDPPLSKSDNHRGPFSKEFYRSSKASNLEELQPRDEQDESTKSTVSPTQSQRGSSSSTYGNSSKSILDDDAGIYNRLILREAFYIFDSKWSSTEAEAVCCPCSSMCSSRFCHTSMTKAQLYISYIATIYCCKFDSKLIPIDFIWLHNDFLILI